jgi:hypothetical protein
MTSRIMLFPPNHPTGLSTFAPIPLPALICLNRLTGAATNTRRDKSIVHEEESHEVHDSWSSHMRAWLS